MPLTKELKISFVSGGVVLFGVLVGFVIFPAIMKSQLRKQMALTKKTDVRQMWENIPFPFHFKVYLFNYTNPDEVQNGGVPIVNEVGPYYFDEVKKKVDIQDHENNDTITYKRLDTFYFRPELSGPGLTGDEYIVIPHPFMLSTGLTVYREKPSMLSVIGKALNLVFENPTDIFFKGKALDLMFSGVMFNCNKTEFAAKALCGYLKKEGAAGLVREPTSKDIFRFSIFGKRNNTPESKVITVRRGSKNVMDVGTVIAINGKPKQSIWRDECNDLYGTDATIYPPFLKKTDPLTTFMGDLCRPFKPWFQKQITYSGISCNRYITNIGDLANDPKLQCYCEAPDDCPPKGLIDMFRCVSAPMYASLPHFLDSDPKLLETTKGLSPDANKHGIEIDFEPISGTPLDVKLRIQFNIEMMKSDKMDLFKHLSGDIVPVFWIDEGYALNKTFIRMLKKQLFIPKRLVNIFRWWVIGVGCFVCLLATTYHFRAFIIRIAMAGETVTKVTPGQVETVQNEEELQKNISVIGQNNAPTKIDM